MIFSCSPSYSVSSRMRNNEIETWSEIWTQGYHTGPHVWLYGQFTVHTTRVVKKIENFFLSLLSLFRPFPPHSFPEGFFFPSFPVQWRRGWCITRSTNRLPKMNTSLSVFASSPRWSVWRYTPLCVALCTFVSNMNTSSNTVFWVLWVIWIPHRVPRTMRTWPHVGSPQGRVPALLYFSVWA